MPATLQPEFQAIRKNRVHEEVAKQLEDLILKKLQPGDKLPAERELAEKLGVSRSSIRDAMRRLHLIGLVEPRQGAGTVVREVSSEALVSPLTNVIAHKRQMVSELLDFRIMLEPPLAGRAAEHATAEQVSRMEEILGRQARLLQSGRLAVEEDAEFHYCVAQASGNSVVLKVLDVVMDLLRETRSQSLQTEGRPSRSLAGHKRILAAIKRKDGAGAETAMRQHISDVSKIVNYKLS
ncbi:MAG TPA: FadR/GntR family transcriptional regulator [Candidatus Angelobacter sp.]|nr:FadR/GntR family transcriptional regulator [Candidatus Angelobacter sp.]